MDSTTLIHLTCIVLSESSQSWKATYCMIPLLWQFEQTKPWGRKHINEPEERVLKITTTEQNKKEQKEETLRDLWDNKSQIFVL